MGKEFTANLIVLSGDTSDGTTNVFEVYDSSNNIQHNIDTRGFQRIEWRDEYVAGELILGSGNGLPPILIINLVGEEDGDGNSTLLIRSRNFDNTNRVAYGSFEINHDVDTDKLNSGEVSLEAHVHWIPVGPGAGDMVWQLDYMVLGANGVNSSPYTVTAIDTVPINSQNRQRLKSFNNHVLEVPTNGWGIGDVIAFAIRANASTTYTGGKGLLKVALHVPVNSRGSRQRFIK